MATGGGFVVKEKVCASVKEQQTGFSATFGSQSEDLHPERHTPGCSCNPNCSSAKSSAQPLSDHT